jgi:hypothetical protein
MKLFRMVADWLLLLMLLAVALVYHHWFFVLTMRVVHWKASDWINAGTRLMVTCSFLHTFLPPWDWEPEVISVGFSEFPGVQRVFRITFHNRYYKAFIYLIGYVALNIRSTIWHYISIENKNGPNANMPTNSMTVGSTVVEVQQLPLKPAGEN